MVVACSKVVFGKSHGETKNDHVKISLSVEYDQDSNPVPTE
jgi:hypothetical protein